MFLGHCPGLTVSSRDFFNLFMHWRSETQLTSSCAIWIPLNLEWDSGTSRLMATQEQKNCVKACFTVLKSSTEQSSFQLNVESNVHIALVLSYFALRLVKKKQHHFLDQSKVKPIPILACSQPFPAWRRLNVFACRSEWFIALFVSVQCNWQITTRYLFAQFTKINELWSGHKLCYVLYIAITALKKTALTLDSNLLTASKESIKKKLHISWWSLVLFPFFIAIQISRSRSDLCNPTK